MSPGADIDPQQPQSATKSKKHKKKKSKAANNSKPNGANPQHNGAPEQVDEEHEDDNEEIDNAEEPRAESNNDTTKHGESESKTVDTPPSTARRKSSVAVNGDGPRPGEDPDTSDRTSMRGVGAQDANSSDSSARLEAAMNEREQLRDEVSELRKQLEGLQQKHAEETGGIRQQLEESQKGREHAEARYNKLYGQINNIKAQLGERLQADAAELEQARGRIEQLQTESSTHRNEKESLEAETSKLRSDATQQAKEIETLRGRTNTSQQNWAKERDDLVAREASAREEFDAARQAMQDWEVLAMEERSLREGLSERMAELEDQLSSQREAHDRAAAERDDQSNTVDGLQRALKEVHDARKEERRELVESNQAQQQSLRDQLNTAETSLREAQNLVTSTRSEIDRLGPLEKEVREKSLLIGKLRHEAVILNDHLTKALRFLKRAKPDDNVDRQLVTNYVLQFLALDRSDPKKFQVLQLISTLLGWTEEQNEQAGLARPGATTSTGSLKVPLSAPFRRVSSSVGLAPLSPSIGSSNAGPPLKSPGHGSFSATDSPARGEGLAELWSEFLEREAEEGQRSRRGSIRRSSGASTPQLKAQPTPASPGSIGSPPINIQKSRLDRVGEDAADQEKAG